MQKIARGILFFIGVIFLFIGFSLLWGMWSPWIHSYLMGATFVAFAIATLWVAYTQAYQVLIGAGLSMFVTFAGSSIYFLQHSGENIAFFYFGRLGVMLAIIALWFFFLGLNSELQITDRLPLSVQWLIAVVFSVSIMEGIFLVAPVPGHFAWLLTDGQSVAYGWVLLGASIFFGWSLIMPFWENGYPLLYSLLAFDLLLVGPLFSLLREDPGVAVNPLYLTTTLIVVVGTALGIIYAILHHFYRPEKEIDEAEEVKAEI